MLFRSRGDCYRPPGDSKVLGAWGTLRKQYVKIKSLKDSETHVNMNMQSKVWKHGVKKRGESRGMFAPIWQPVGKKVLELG